MPGDVRQFLERNELTYARPGREVFESAMACDGCGQKEVGERHEVEGHSRPHQIPLTFFVCTPCKEGIDGQTAHMAVAAPG